MGRAVRVLIKTRARDTPHIATNLNLTQPGQPGTRFWSDTTVQLGVHVTEIFEEQVTASCSFPSFNTHLGSPPRTLKARCVGKAPSSTRRNTIGLWPGWRPSIRSMGMMNRSLAGGLLLEQKGVTDKAFASSTCSFLLRTVLNREPVLGSQRLDLLKVYKLVTAHGGCEKVHNTKFSSYGNLDWRF